MKLYKHKYIIGIYEPEEDGEMCLAIVDNVKQFAEFLKISVNNASVTLDKLFRHEISGIRYFGKICTVAFIEE